MHEFITYKRTCQFHHKIYQTVCIHYKRQTTLWLNTTCKKACKKICITAFYSISCTLFIQHKFKFCNTFREKRANALSKPSVKLKTYLYNSMEVIAIDPKFTRFPLVRPVCLPKRSVEVFHARLLFHRIVPYVRDYITIRMWIKGWMHG